MTLVQPVDAPNLAAIHLEALTLFLRRALQLCGVCFLVAWFPVSSAEDSVDFAKQIAPLFQQHCINCHSPGIEKGDVSLATIEDLTQNEFIVAGDPDASSLMQLISSEGGARPEMPKEQEPLTNEQVQLVRTWISQGAKWPRQIVIQEKSKADENWWSLQPIQVPNASKSIDAFIQEKLSEHHLALSPPTDRVTLIRRLSFDLLGLPPSPEAVVAFVNDPDPRAYENLVDRMLNADEFGERYARHWLDIAHYADTHGFERDQRRNNAWRYRDYVIQSFNEDRPYDRFLQEQIAGDVLWPHDDQAVIATGFLAAGPWDFVGQVETQSDMLRRAARSLDLDDMATQVMTATMGVTINCARCHDHKLDPISQQEYYGLQSVFAGVKRAERVVSEVALQRYEEDQKELTAKVSDIDLEIRRLEGAGLDLADIVGGGNGLGSGTKRQGIDARTGKFQTRELAALDDVIINKYSESESPLVDGVFVPGGEPGTAKIPISSTGITFAGLPQNSGMAWDSIRNGPVASQHSPELGGINFTNDGHSLLGLHANAGITFDLASLRQEMANNDMRFTAKLGYFGAPGDFHADVWILIDGQKVAGFHHLRRDDGLQNIDIEIPNEAMFLTLIATDGGNGYSHDQVGFGDPRLNSTTPLPINYEDQQRLSQLRDQHRIIDGQLAELRTPPQFYGVVAEKELAEVKLLLRGDPESPVGEPLPPAAFAALRMLDPALGTCQTEEGQRRAALALWITNPDSPLTPRVIVNRLWQWHFGRGIVETASDFGFGGGRPSHPELLDWLAAELPKRNWSLKAIIKLIVTSKTYRQESRFSKSAGGIAVDADNRLLWRQNPRRIDAEAIRDAVLFVTGKLNPQRGGPGFEDFNYQEAYAPIYTYVTADKPEHWRRSIYRYIVRTTPDRFLTTFDCPDPANLTPARLTTTTPLQSLALYNNDFMLRQSRYFAQRIEQEAGFDQGAQAQRAFQLAFGRHASDDELTLATEFIKAQGLFALCRSLLNANEFLYVD